MKQKEQQEILSFEAKSYGTDFGKGLNFVNFSTYNLNIVYTVQFSNSALIY